MDADGIFTSLTIIEKDELYPCEARQVSVRTEVARAAKCATVLHSSHG
jgi:hypothetical protein